MRRQVYFSGELAYEGYPIATETVDASSMKKRKRADLERDPKDMTTLISLQLNVS